MAELTKGDQAPDFHLTDQNGNGWRLGDFEGHFLVLFFYKQNGTTRCTKQVEGFRDQHEAFKRLGAKIVGISPDDEVSHHEFAARFRLPFNLLADIDLEAATAYAVLETGNRPRRATFLIGPDATVLKTFQTVTDTKKHAAEVLEELEEHVTLPTPNNSKSP